MKTNTKIRLVDPKKTKKIDYKKRSFKKGLSEVEKAILKTNSLSFIDDSKLHYSFSI